MEDKEEEKNKGWGEWETVLVKVDTRVTCARGGGEWETVLVKVGTRVTCARGGVERETVLVMVDTRLSRDSRFITADSTATCSPCTRNK